MNEILKHEQNKFKKIMSEMGSLRQNLSEFKRSLYYVLNTFDEEGLNAEREEIDLIIDILKDVSDDLENADDDLFMAADRIATLNRG